MKEKLTINIDGTRDKIKGIEEYENVIIVTYEKNGQIRSIEIPREVINFVKDIIDYMEVGEPYKSIFVYNKFIKKYRLQSKIISQRMTYIQQTLRQHDIAPQTIGNILCELNDNDDFILMPFVEFIGTRKTEISDYFKLYGSIRYWKEKGIINYNSRGTIIRLI